MADMPDRTATDVTKELGIHVGQIYNWRVQFNKLSKGQFTVADGTNYSVAEKAKRRKLEKEVAQSGLFEYIELFYNRQRRHSAIEYLSPHEYEMNFIN